MDIEGKAKLKAWMDAKGFTLSTLARELDVTENYIYKLLAGTKPLGNGFEFRFLKHFGASEHEKLFDAVGQPKAELEKVL